MDIFVDKSIRVEKFLIDEEFPCQAAKKEDELKCAHIKEKRSSEKTDIKRNNHGGKLWNPLRVVNSLNE